MNDSPFNTIHSSYRDFKVTKVQQIPEINCTLRELVHEKTGAAVIHIENDDPENLFCLSFQTLPDSSNGVAHILEHTVLCGSQKYPVKDPFFAMSRRSLNTFMNALTGSDFTCYPASSQIPQDFYNLLEVYLDAVFHPKLSELSFRQEGHRLEFEDPEDISSPLVHRGVVFNEMKGVMNSASSRLHESMHSALFPHLTYGFNSGGDPKVIPHLNYEELIAFHNKFYHPGRCLFFFYGNIPLERHLDFIIDKALSGVEKAPPLPPIPEQPRFKEPVKIQSSYPLAPHEDPKDKALIAFGWLTCPLIEQQVCLALSILEIVLLETDASPLKHILLHSGLCKQVGSYMDTEISEVPFIIQLKGCDEKNAGAIESLLLTSLQKIADEGISFKAIENAIHQLEFHRSEITGDYAPFGLSLFMRSALLKQHGGQPENGLMIHSLFDELRKKDSSYFSGLIKKYLIDNPHFVRVVLTPDKELDTLELAEEKQVLKEIKERLLDEEKKQLVAEARRLKEFQKSLEDEDQDILPKVALSDVPKNARVFALEELDIGNIDVFHHGCFTNDIVYADLVFDMPPLPEEDMPFVRLLTILLPQVGANGRSYEENLEYIQANTGGLSAYISLNLQAQNHDRFYPSFHIRGKALGRKAKQLFPLLRDIAETPELKDEERIRTIIMKHYTALESSLNSSSLKYAINLSASGLNLPSKLAEDWYGLQYYWSLRSIALNFEAKKDFLIEKLLSLKERLLCVGRPNLIVASDMKTFEKIKLDNFYALANLQTKASPPWSCDYPLIPVPSQGRTIASPVAFTGKVFQTVSYVHEDAPALNIAAFLFDNLTLHKLIREQGGAYGGGAVSNVLSGNFYFYSYRDPNIASTLDAFTESIKHILSGDFDDSDLEEAKLEMIQSLDSPVSPGSRADVAYTWKREGKTLEVRQEFRDKILSLDRKDIIGAIERHIVPNIQHGSDVVFAGRELLEKENAILTAKGLKPLEILTLDERN